MAAGSDQERLDRLTEMLNRVAAMVMETDGPFAVILLRRDPDSDPDAVAIAAALEPAAPLDASSDSFMGADLDALPPSHKAAAKVLRFMAEDSANDPMVSGEDQEGRKIRPRRLRRGRR